jgi:hypothetical protein
MLRGLTNSDQKGLLAVYEHIYSAYMSADVPQERDARIPKDSHEYNIAASLNRFSEKDLQNLILNKYNTLIDENKIEEQTTVARAALDLAKRVLGDGKKIPLTILENLIPNHIVGRESRHVTIAISGFESQADDNVKEWSQLVKELSESKTSVFCYRWESSIPSDKYKAILRGAKGAFTSVFALLKSPLKALSKKITGPIAAAIGVFELANGPSQLFKENKDRAKVAGKLLACAVALRDPFPGQTISIIGFSLGT